MCLTNLGVKVVPSEANFLLARFTTPSADTVFNALKAHGIFVRPVKSLPDCLRISVGTPEECQTFLNALRKIIESKAS